MPRFHSLIAALVLVPAALAGPLTPAAAPAPTYRTLQEVYDKADAAEVQANAAKISAQTAAARATDLVMERIAVGPDTTPGDATAKYIISQPGSYYLTSRIVGPSTGIAIKITASNVTLDLNGYQIDNAQTGVHFSGASTAAPRSGLVLRNGTIVIATTGVEAQFSAGCVFEDLVIRSCTTGLRAGADSIVRGVNSTFNATAFVAGDKNLFERCVGSFATSAGFIVGDNNVLRACLAVGTASIVNQRGVTAGMNAIVEGCTVASFGGGGLSVGSVSRVTGSNVFNNATGGVLAADACVVEGCLLNANAGAAVTVANNSAVRANTIDFHPQATCIVLSGTRNLVENNRLTRAATGVLSTTAGNVIVRNTLSQCSTNISAPGSEAPLVTTTSGATNPFANLAF